MGYEALAWDSDFFGIPIGRVSPVADESLAAEVEEADADGRRCLYMLCPLADLSRLHLAIELGFRPYDVRVELSGAVSGDRERPARVRDAHEDDEAALAGLVRERVRGTRFWNDLRFPRDRVEDLYVEWLRRGMSTAPARQTFAVGEADGFVTCQLDRAAGVGRIELIAVAADCEGEGLGDALIQAAGNAFAEAGLERAEVVTQAQNVRAQRLYQRNGYRTANADVWMHRWVEGDLR